MAATTGKGSSSNSVGRPLWSDAPTVFTPRSAVVEIYGPSNTGRTTLALSAPPPILYIYFYEKAEGIIEPFAREKQISWYRAGGVFRGESDEIQRAAWRKMEEFERCYYEGLGERSPFRSIVVDTHVEAWELERLAEFGAPKPGKGRVDQMWGGVNARWSGLLNAARERSDVNVIWIGQVEDEWKKDARGFDQKTGKQVKISSSAGRKVYLKCDVSLRTDNGADGQSFTATIEKAWGNNDLMFEELQVEREGGLPFILSLITGTEQSEWES